MSVGVAVDDVAVAIASIKLTMVDIGSAGAPKGVNERRSLDAQVIHMIGNTAAKIPTVCLDEISKVANASEVQRLDARWCRPLVRC